LIANRDFTIEKLPAVLCPRPGHADLAGVLKYGFKDARDVLERASARETASRVAIGAVCKVLLREFKIHISSSMMMIGGECSPQKMLKKIMQATSKKDTVGGIFAVVASGVPIGIGSYVQADRRLDARLAQDIISIPGIKAVGFGLGFGYAHRFGSEVHDAIYFTKNRGYFRKTNNAGGIEGGMSNGEDIVIHACMKPIATLLKPLDSVNLSTKKSARASVERSDICVVEAAAVIAEAGCSFVLADAFLEKFGGDNLQDIKQNYRSYLKRIS
jgi:chorismate synthase